MSDLDKGQCPYCWVEEGEEHPPDCIYSPYDSDGYPREVDEDQKLCTNNQEIGNVSNS